jgi:hypothetical protein
MGQSIGRWSTPSDYLGALGILADDYMGVSSTLASLFEESWSIHWSIC